MAKYSKQDINEWFEDLSRELVWSQIHLQHAQTIYSIGMQYKDLIARFADIWGCAYWAHIDSATMCLCRVYDRTGLNIEKLLVSIKQHPDWLDKSGAREEVRNHPALAGTENQIKDIDVKQLKQDIERVSSTNPLVKRLQSWRDKSSFHKTPDSIWDSKTLLAKYPITIDDMEKLAKQGLKILNRHSTQTVGRRSYVEFDLHNEYRRMFRLLARHKDTRNA